MNALLFAAPSPWSTFAAKAKPLLEAWEAVLEDPAAAQQQRLQQIVKANRDTAFGRRHRFDLIGDSTEYHQRVPIHSYKDLAPWIDRAMQENQPVLTAHPPKFFERTSGNSALHKTIPYTADFLHEMQATLTVWLADLYRHLPEVGSGRSYWSMSPPQQAPGRAANGIPIGSASDLEYLDGSLVAGLASTLLMPAISADMHQWRQQTLLAMIEAEDLSFISVWSPTFLLSLLRPLFDEGDVTRADTLTFLAANLSGPRSVALRYALDSGTCDKLWPRLAAISCWMDGPSRHYAALLPQRFPQARLMAKGLFATEGVVSLPFGASPDAPNGCPLAIQSHYLEFAMEDGSVRGAEELRLGDTAEVLLTTGGGLYRYALGDRILVSGMAGRTPRIVFLGRSMGSCDLVGEKIEESVTTAIFAASLDGADHACMVPCTDSPIPHYVVILASSGSYDYEYLRETIEVALLRSFHYAHARKMAQLGPAQLHVLPNASNASNMLGALLQQAAEQCGIRAGDVKPQTLINQIPMAKVLLKLAHYQ